MTDGLMVDLPRDAKPQGRSRNPKQIQTDPVSSEAPPPSHLPAVPRCVSKRPRLQGGKQVLSGHSRGQRAWGIGTGNWTVKRSVQERLGAPTGFLRISFTPSARGSESLRAALEGGVICGFNASAPFVVLVGLFTWKRSWDSRLQRNVASTYLAR